MNFRRSDHFKRDFKALPKRIQRTVSILPGTKVAIGTPEQEVVQHEARTA